MELNYNTLVDILNNEKIDFEITEHKSLFTVKESEEINNKIIGAHTKNLFLKNKKNNFFLFSCKNDTSVNLKELSKNSIFKNLSFANESYLKEFTRMTPGSVNPFGLLFDKKEIVSLYLDIKLLDHEIVNFHPMINTATISIKVSSFLGFMKRKNKLVNLVNFDTNQVIKK
jgi:Ala-tRNA(Pro) deacylase|tara:strand:+ start:809 stop:1321 length:513 start_codon:yes stop_codon:yes gene_type:complete